MDQQNLQPLYPKLDQVIPVSAGKRYVASDQYILRTIAGENVLVSVGENAAFDNGILSLNDSFAFLWQLYQEPITLDEAIQKATMEYDDSEGTMKDHIKSFLWQNVQMGLLIESE